MKKFSYKITDPIGLHARPAGLFVRAASAYQSTVSICKGDKSADAKKIFAVMGLAVKCDEEVTITLDGPDEDIAAKELLAFMAENF